MSRTRELATRAALALGAAAMLMLLIVPIAALLLRVHPGTLFERLLEPEILAALRLSLVTSVSATFLVVATGLPLAYLLARRQFRGKRVLEVLVDLPMVLPPTVAGFALLLAFGRAGLTGRALEAFGVSLPFTTLGVIVAQAFMSAPFFITSARAGLAAVDPRYLDAAATLRASELDTFFRVVLPLSMPLLVAGAAMSGARALGEFGATITFAGNLPGVTQTMPLAVYVALQSDLDSAIVLSVVLLAIAFTLLFWLRRTAGGGAFVAARASR